MIVFAPFERVGILLACENAMLKSGKSSTPYSDELDCFFRIIDTEGVTGLWRGNLANLLRYVPSRIYTSQRIKRRYNNRYSTEEEDDESYFKRICSKILNSTVSEFIPLFLSYPFEYARTQLALDIPIHGQFRYKGIRDVFSTTYHNHGISYLYTGFGVQFAQIFIFKTISICMHELLHAFLPKEIKTNRFISCFKALCSTIPAQICTYPLEVIQKRMLFQVGHTTNSTTANTNDPLSMIDTILDEEGEEAFFKGIELKVLITTLHTAFSSLFF